MLKWTLAAFAAVIVIFLVVVAMQPSDFKVERKRDHAQPAPAAVVRRGDTTSTNGGLVAVGADGPNLKRPLRRPAAGTGAVLCLGSATSNVGEGRMTILESQSGRAASDVKLEFFEPFAAANQAHVHLRACQRPIARPRSPGP